MSELSKVAPGAVARALRDLADKFDQEGVDLLEAREERGSDLGEVRLFLSYRTTPPAGH